MIAARIADAGFATQHAGQTEAWRQEVDLLQQVVSDLRRRWGEEVTPEYALAHPNASLPVTWQGNIAITPDDPYIDDNGLMWQSTTGHMRVGDTVILAVRAALTVEDGPVSGQMREDNLELKFTSPRPINCSYGDF
jgi:hypothetical protein